MSQDQKQPPTDRLFVGDDMLVHAPKNTIVHINEVWAFLSVDKDDNTEGIIAMHSPMGPLPMIAADAARLMSLLPEVEKMVQQSGVTVRLVKFTNREEVRLIEKK